MVSCLVASKYDGILAQFYDADHHWRDYKKQASLLCSIYSYVEKKKVRVLDIGCGTGSHALELARNGFQVAGIDCSGTLLKIAKEKTIQFHKQIRFSKKDFFKMRPNSNFYSFDCALFLGWSLNIAPFYERFSKLLERTSPLLKPGGFFIFDAAIGPVTQKITGRSLKYKISQALHGTLKIQEEVDAKKSLRYLTYDWHILKNHSPKPREFHLQAKENLVILQPEMLYETIKKHSAYFETVKILGDYNLDAPYLEGNKNFIAVLRRKI